MKDLTGRVVPTINDFKSYNGGNNGGGNPNHDPKTGRFTFGKGGKVGLKKKVEDEKSRRTEKKDDDYAGGVSVAGEKTEIRKGPDGVLSDVKKWAEKYVDREGTAIEQDAVYWEDKKDEGDYSKAKYRYTFVDKKSGDPLGGFSVGEDDFKDEEALKKELVDGIAQVQGNIRATKLAKKGQGSYITPTMLKRQQEEKKRMMDEIVFV